MAIKGVYGHDQNQRILVQAIKQNTVGHAYLFSGPAGVGKKTVARSFATNLLCLNKIDGAFACGKCSSCQKVERENHPDLEILRPDGTRIKIEQLRLLQKKLFYKPYEADYKVYIIEEADTMTLEAANSILKILEEPPVEAIFILISAKPYALLPTVLSRCQKLQFHKVNTEVVSEFIREQFQIEKDKAEFLATLSDGNLTIAKSLADSGEILTVRNEIIEIIKAVLENDKTRLIKIANELEKRKDEFLVIIDLITLFYRDLIVWKETENISLIINKDQSEFIQKVSKSFDASALMATLGELERLKKYLNQNVNYRVIVDNLILVLNPNYFGRLINV